MTEGETLLGAKATFEVTTGDELTIDFDVFGLTLGAVEVFEAEEVVALFGPLAVDAEELKRKYLSTRGY